MLQQPVGASRTLEFDFGPVQLDGDLKLEMLKGNSEVSRTPQGLVVTTHLNTVVEAECGRCLKSIALPIQTEFTEMFVFAHKDRGEDEHLLPEDGDIDLGPIAREQFLLEVPINVLCRPDCKGLCAVCGANLNEEDCGHRPDPIDPRLASLRSLLDDQSN